MFLISNKMYFKRINFFGIITGFYILAIVIILLSFPVAGEASPKFLIFHLDAVSSQNFFQYMEDGDLPNLQAVFEDGHMIHHGLSLFPGGTETAVPHLREGVDNSTGGVGWGYYDREKEKVIPAYKTFFYWLSYLPRELNPVLFMEYQDLILLCFFLSLMSPSFWKPMG